MTFNALDSAAARSAIARGDDYMLERYLREGGANKSVVSITAATVTLNRIDHEGRITLFNRAAGIVATLPAATGSQDKYTVIVQTTLTGSGVIKVGNTTDVLTGNVGISTATFAAASNEAATGADDTLTMNGSTTGGLQGSKVECVDIAAGLWMIDANLVGSGAVATALSTSV
jgi:hypothetical protein